MLYRMSISFVAKINKPQPIFVAEAFVLQIERE